VQTTPFGTSHIFNETQLAFQSVAELKDIKEKERESAWKYAQ
jgi:hypothetical protein